MASKKEKKKKQTKIAPEYNGICHVSNKATTAKRCSPRLHFYADSVRKQKVSYWGYYEYLYKSKMLNIKNLGFVDSLEELLRDLDKQLRKSENKGKLVGDLIILTHSTPTKVNGTKVVYLTLAPVSERDPDGSPRPSPWEIPTDVDSEDIEELQDPSSYLYKRVDGKHVQDGLMTKIVPRIVKHMDSSTHIWFAGCDIGSNLGLLKTFRKFFHNKPTIYALKQWHHYAVTKDPDGKVIGGHEIVCPDPVKPEKSEDETYYYCPGAPEKGWLWTNSGIKSIVHVP